MTAWNKVPLVIGILAAAAGRAPAADPVPAADAKRVVVAHVVALDQAFMLNRLGAAMPQGMVFALKRDVVNVDDPDGSKRLPLAPGKVRLRDGHRPRPLVLRANVGDELRIEFTNLVAEKPVVAGSGNQQVSQPATRSVGVSVMGLNWIAGPSADAAFVGMNLNSLAVPGATRTYRLYAKAEGTYLLTSAGADAPLVANHLMTGLFGAVNVEPAGAVWYRSQVTRKELAAASATVPGHDLPKINYEAVAPDGTPVLNMLKKIADARPGVPAFELVSGDLTAVIAGPNGGLFPPPPPNIACNPVYQGSQSREKPYREVTILYHDAFTVVPPFDPNDPGAALAMQGGAEAFAINYGSAAIGSEILANRIGVGPMANTAEAKFEEFFLSSWVCGDPAMVVDVPANTPKSAPPPPPDPKRPNVPVVNPPAPGNVTHKLKATKAFYPSDPSNVYHSYLHDRVIFRVLHAGSGIPHIHHQHAHQWLRTPLSDKSLLLDSQTIIPGDGFSLEMVYGSGNRNLTAGDSIFHCHFYPHFAGGLWALWRVHDVFEAGTELDATGRPVPGARALPDGEIATGTPIPGLVPLPTLAMAPAPAAIKIVPATGPDGKALAGAYKAELQDPVKDAGKNPGYPFFIPGIGGRRAPHPPLDFALDEATGQPLDGGLPRHVVLSGTVSYEKHNNLDFSKEVDSVTALRLPEEGTPLEKAAMNYHAKLNHPTFTPDGKAATFTTNGTGPKHGAPYANPARTLEGKAIDGPVVRYKAADIQMDVVFNKKGWHYPQQRMIALWGDVGDTLSGARPPEPLFFRANSGSIIEFWQTNLIPDYYELDDFQVRTPTDVVGQHIHLVKFDVTSSDGAANGFNYEDGTFSPDEVRKRIAAINKTKGLWSFDMKGQTQLAPKSIPFFGPGPNGTWVGAQTTVQRWYADPLLDCAGDDRTLGTVFTHDHLGPSTHQQAGLYAGLLIEPAGSKWLDNTTGAPLGGRTSPPIGKDGKATKDGGPTSWEAVIETAKADQSYREFALAFQDFQLAYQPTSIPKAVPYTPYPGPLPPAQPWGWVDPTNAVASPGGAQLAPSLFSTPPEPGGRSLNYRSEPIPFRVAQPGGAHGPLDPRTDLAQAYRSIPRLDPALNKQPVGPVAPGSPFKFPGGFRGAGPTDPYTPLLRSFADDRVNVRVLVGAHHNPHAFALKGANWLVEPDVPDSGYTSNQQMSISEYFEFQFRVPPGTTAPAPGGRATDYLYQPSADTDGVANGVWGLMRAYDPRAKEVPKDLARVPGNAWAKSPADAPTALKKFYDGIPKTRVREYNVSAILAPPPPPDAIRGSSVPSPLKATLRYVLDTDLVKGQLKPGVPYEPLILRAAAGDLIRVNLTNRLNPKNPLFATAQPFQGPPLAFSATNGYPSAAAGFSPQLLGFDAGKSAGADVGVNPVQTVEPGKNTTYEWYAGRLDYRADGTVAGTPVEFGTVNLFPADPFFQHPFGLFGMLIVEPEGSSWTVDVGTHASATVTAKGHSFREFVLGICDQVPTQTPVQPNTTLVTGNYRADPLNIRIPAAGGLASADQTAILSDTLRWPPGGTTPIGDPSTPIFFAVAGDAVRFRVGHTFGNDYTCFTIHNHTWQTQPFTKGSTVLGANPRSPWTGSTGQLPPTGQGDILIDSAGGRDKLPGDYLYRDFSMTGYQGGMWGVMRVVPPSSDGLIVRATPDAKGQTVLSGTVSRSPGGAFAKEVIVTADGQPVGKAAVDPTTGTWSLAQPVPAPGAPNAAQRIEVASAGGGRRVLHATPAAVAPTAVMPVPAIAADRAQRFLRLKPPLR